MRETHLKQPKKDSCYFQVLWTKQGPNRANAASATKALWVDIYT